MKANELRIGNIVSYDGKEYSIHSVTPDFPYLNTIEFGFGVVTWEHINPIPLTPEVLEKCGFDRIGNLANHGNRIFYKAGRLILESIPDNRVAVSIDAKIESTIICFLEHLHQLQNLYLSLTGTELIYTA